MQKRGNAIAWRVDGKRLGKERKNKIIRHVSISITIIAVLTLTFLYFSHNLPITGNAGSIQSQAGYITSVNLHIKLPVNYWAGIYGFALTVPGLEDQFSEDVITSFIERSDVFFGCIQQDAINGAEFYASTGFTLDFSDVQPATIEEIDAFTGCTGNTYCANQTFTETIDVFIGQNNISNVPATYTYKFDGNNTLFQMGALNVSGYLTFVAKLKPIQKGFSPNVTVNYQLLLPGQPNQTTTWYFYNDPYDECPPGGLGNSINSSLSGYIFNENAQLLANATVNVAGNTYTTNSSGFYNVSFDVLPGTYNVVVTRENYKPYIDNVSVNLTSFIVFRNYTLIPEVITNTITPVVHGLITDNAGNIISQANVTFGQNTTSSNQTGNYYFTPTLFIGSHPIIAIKTGYNNYVSFLNISSNTTIIEHDIIMETSQVSSNVGPGTDDPGNKNKDADFDEIQKQAEEVGQDYWIAPNEINVQVRKNTFIEQKISIYNFRSITLSTTLTLSSELSDFVTLDRSSLTLGSNTAGDFFVTIYGTPELGVYEGSITLTGDLEQTIPVRIEVVDRRLPIETLFLNIDLLKRVISPGSTLKYRLLLQNLLSDQSYKVLLTKKIIDDSGKEFVTDEPEEVEIENSLTILRELNLPEDIPEGKYLLRVNAKFFNLYLTVEQPFIVAKPLYLFSVFGIPLWLLLIIVSTLSFLVFNFFLYRHVVNKKKRYHLRLNTALLPKDGPRSIKLGTIAETKLKAYYDLDMLTTHAIIAGATGGGKSIAAQVIIEEALLKNIAVVVFDPTAQWSGMLRKCEDKKMLSFYPKFGLKPSDSKAFAGNVRQITNSRQLIKLDKYLNPGQIQIFTLNKLDPSEMDIFVGNIIASIFRSNPKEHPGLKAIIIFDEVHRLLPKFGGSGVGFLQIERACREFRKWGLGVMLVSQVLSDFVGEIKANINTELQMRVAEENDLERIKERYGLDALKSLVRADIGVGMFQNAEYNRGLPYFVNLRPILHSTRRLSDEVLEKYNSYNETIDDIEYEIKQLEEINVDTFDMKMELKLVKDKLMAGNFTVVDIYLEGLKPRLIRQWETIGKKPKKREIALASEEDLKKSLDAAQKDRAKWDKKNAPKIEGNQTEKTTNSSIISKIVKSLTFDNGMMVSSLKEFMEVIPSLDDAVLAIHVNDEKNEIAQWIGNNIDKNLGTTLMIAKTKEKIIAIINDFIKQQNKENEKKEEKEANEKTEESTNKTD